MKRTLFALLGAAAMCAHAQADVGGSGVGSKIAWQGAGGYTNDFEMVGLTWTTLTSSPA